MGVVKLGELAGEFRRVLSLELRWLQGFQTTLIGVQQLPKAAMVAKVALD